MRRAAPHANPLAVLLGVLLAVVVVAGVRALHQTWDDGERVGSHWVNVLGLAVSAAALALSVVERADFARRWRPSRPVATALASGLAALSVAVYTNLGDDLTPYHPTEHFHYYLGAKYFPELSYTRIYQCAAIAEAERFGRQSMADDRMRDLTTNQLVPAVSALDDPGSCKRHFSVARWSAFVGDVAWFRRTWPGAWHLMQEDYGYNPPPTWALLGHALASIAPAGPGTQIALASIDPLLLLAAFGMIWWAFGPYVLWIALVVWGCQFPAAGGWTLGGFLRQDWFVFLVASVCLARRRRAFLAGLAIASAAALRIFPALLLGMPLLVIARRAWQRGAVARFDRRFAAGVLAGGVAWLGLSTAVFGGDAWRQFTRHIALHRMAPVANQIGLGAALSQTIDGRLTQTYEEDAVDPFGAWAATRRDTFAARRPLYLALLAGAIVLAVATARHVRRLWCALAASSLLVVTAVDVSSYYCAFFVVLGLLAATSRVEEWLALAAVTVSRGVNALPFLKENPDVGYMVQSVVFVAWAVLSVAFFWPQMQPRRVTRRRSPPGRKRSRRRA